MAFVVSKKETIQYDGTNGAAVVAFVDNGTLTSDNGTTLVFSIYDVDNFTFTAGEHWLARTQDNGHKHFAGSYTNAQYAESFIELP